MSTTQAPSRRGRRAPQEGPRASLKQLLPFLFEHRRVLVIVAILSVIGAAATLAQPLLVGLLIGRVEAGEPLGMLVWGVVLLVVVASVISGYQHYLLQRTGTAVVYSSRRKLVARILHLPIAEFDARRTGDLVSRVGTDTTLLYAVLTQGLADAVGNSLIFLGALIAMAIIDPVLLALIVVVIGVSITGVVLLSGRIREATRDQQELVGQLTSGVERAVGSIRTVRAAGAGDREEAAISGLAEDTYDQGVRIAKVSALIVPIAGIALQLSLLVVLGVGGLRVASGAITIAALVTFIMFLFMLIAPLGSTFGAITSVNQALGALGRIQEILDLPTETQGDAELAASVRGADDTCGRRSGCRALGRRDRVPRRALPLPRSRRRGPPQGRVRGAGRARERARRHVHPGRGCERGRGARRRWRRRRATGRARCCAACRSRCRAARASRWSGRPAPARARRSPSSSGSTTRPAARSSSTARMPARSTATGSAPDSATWSRMPRPSPGRSRRTCDWPRPRHPMRTANACCAR